MTDPDTVPSLRDLAHAAAHASDATAEWLASLTALGRSLHAAHAAGSSVGGIGRELVRGLRSARHHRAQNRIRPSIRLAEHSAEVIAVAAANGFGEVRVFGSCVYGTDTLSSDVDLIVGTGPHTSLLDFVRFTDAVEDLLNLEPGRVDVLDDDALRPGSDSGAPIAAECQPLDGWAARWPLLDSLPGWRHARAAGASEEELVEAAECGLHPWGETATALRNLPAGRPAGATLVDPGELVRVATVLAAYAAGIADGLPHDAALTRAVTRN